MIRHSVVFRLKHPLGSNEEQHFLQALAQLQHITGVQNFSIQRQVSPKNPYRFVASMDFEDAAAYAHYSTHPEHDQFVQQYWIPEVAEFIELDYQDL